MSWEREFYVVGCLGCGETGTALWEENDGPSFLRDPCTVVSVSEPFSWQAVGPLGCEPFFGRVLVCKTCGGPACAQVASPWPWVRRGDHAAWLCLRPGA
jgi:hypothetical protein